ncbi:MAG: cupin domain-containing protein [Gammaproteobacteria bacterium]|nr:cupin domain-containing protein [Gammaproteobacteria bacterium]
MNARIKQASQITAPDGRELETMLAPIGVETFLHDYADKKALLIKGSPSKFDFLNFTVDAFFESADKFGTEANRVKVALSIEGETENYEQIYPFQARNLYRSGKTICVAGISDANATLAAFAEGVRLALSIPDLRFNSYLSPDAQGFDLHYDVQPIFLMQIAGRKKWWYSAQPINPTPRVYSREWQEKPKLDELEHCTLEPGDVLYLPAFSWHHASAVEFSLGITLGTKGWHNLPITAMFESSPFSGKWPYKEMLPPLPPNSIAGGIPESAKAYLTEQLSGLKEYVSGLTEENLWQAWMREVQTSKGPTLPRLNTHLMQNQFLRLSNCFPVNYALTKNEQGEEVITVYHACHQMALPIKAKPLLLWILQSREPFKAFDVIRSAGLEGVLRWTDIHPLLTELVAIRVIEIAR